MRSARKPTRTTRRRKPDAASGNGTPTSGVPVVTLPASLAVRDVAEVAQRLRAAIAGGALVVDASAVAAVDTAGLQLLLAAERSARERGISTRWLGTSEVLKRAAAALGLGHAVGFAAGG